MLPPRQARGRQRPICSAPEASNCSESQLQPCCILLRPQTRQLGSSRRPGPTHTPFLSKTFRILQVWPNTQFTPYFDSSGCHHFPQRFLSPQLVVDVTFDKTQCVKSVSFAQQGQPSICSFLYNIFPDSYQANFIGQPFHMPSRLRKSSLKMMMLKMMLPVSNQYKSSKISFNNTSMMTLVAVG